MEMVKVNIDCFVLKLILLSIIIGIFGVGCSTYSTFIMPPPQILTDKHRQENLIYHATRCDADTENFVITHESFQRFSQMLHGEIGSPARIDYIITHYMSGVQIFQIGGEMKGVKRGFYFIHVKGGNLIIVFDKKISKKCRYLKKWMRLRDITFPPPEQD